MPVTNEVEELLQIIGPFYELVDEKRRITQVSDLSSGKLTNSALSGLTQIVFWPKIKRKNAFVFFTFKISVINIYIFL